MTEPRRVSRVARLLRLGGTKNVRTPESLLALSAAIYEEPQNAQRHIRNALEPLIVAVALDCDLFPAHFAPAIKLEVHFVELIYIFRKCSLSLIFLALGTYPLKTKQCALFIAHYFHICRYRSSHSFFTPKS